MKSKKRYVVAFWIAASMVVILAVAMVAVMAAFNATANGGFNISYTAINVNASVTAKYKKTTTVGSGSYTTIKTSDDQDTMTFVAGEKGSGGSTSVTKNFKTTNVTMEKGKALIIHYQIKNTASTSDAANEAFSVAITDNFKTLASSNNLTVKYCTTESTTDTAWKTSLAELGISSVSDGATVNIYVKVTITDETLPVTGVSNANFSFLLAVAEQH